MSNLRSLASVAATLAFAAAATAQVGTFYTFSQSVGAYTPITGGTLLATATSAVTLDDVTYTVALPFAFPYEFGTYTTVQVQTNGHIALGTTLPGTTYTPLSSTAAVGGFISACGRDLQGGYVSSGDRTLGSDLITNFSAVGPIQVGDTVVGAGIPAGTTVLSITGNTIQMSALATTTSVGTAVTAYGPWSEMRWEVQGTAPNQEFVAQWSNFRRYGTTLATTSGTLFNFQIRLKQNGEINCVYGNCTPGAAVVNTTVLHQVGLRGQNNAFPASINNRANTKGVNDDWSLSAPGTANASGMLFNSVAPANVIPNGLTYTWALPAGTIATNTTLGAGCGSSFASYYELFATAGAMNLGNTALTQIGTTVIPGVGALLPVGPTPTVLALTDDSQATYTFANGFSAPGWGTSVTVCSNGFISKAVGNGTGFTPAAATFLAGTQDWYALGWHDMNPANPGSGQVKVEETANLLTITFDGVYDYVAGGAATAANANTMQFQLTSSGDVTYAYGTLSPLGATGFLVGYSPAGPSANPGSRTLLASAPFNLGAADVLPLALAATNRPVQGAATSNWDLSVTNVPATAVLGVDIFGLSDAGIPDLSFFGLGQAGCQLRANLDVVNAWFSTGTTHAYSFAIPPSPSLSNVQLYTQSAILGLANLAETTTSNGVVGLIGTL